MLRIKTCGHYNLTKVRSLWPKPDYSGALQPRAHHYRFLVFAPLAAAGPKQLDVQQVIAHGRLVAAVGGAVPLHQATSGEAFIAQQAAREAS